MKTVPITLFVYNRPWHTKQTVEALQKNKLASDSELFIYSDAPKNVDAEEKVREVREYIKTIDGFKKVTIIQREKNWGLAASIIDGVTNIVNKYGKIIVLEDDLVTSPYFLKFMNDALEFYKNEKRVWHISGWNYPIYKQEYCGTFIWQKMNCWGWGTWSDRWSHFEKNPTKLIDEFCEDMIKRFDLNNNDKNWSQVIDNIEGRINTWAVFWHASIFKNDGFCLNPETSFVRNIGHDGTGVHCKKTNKTDIEILNHCDKIIFSENIVSSKRHVKLVLEYIKKQRKNIFVRVINKISRILIERNLLD